jgi:DNA-binding NarL/FixJ family response regulator
MSAEGLFMNQVVNRVRVLVQASDPLVRAGLRAYLESRPQLAVATGRADEVDVILFVTDRVSTETVTDLRRSAAAVGSPVVLVADDVDERALLTLISCHVVAVLPRHNAVGSRLTPALLGAATGDAMMSPALLGKLLGGIRSLQRDVLAPQGLNADGLSSREVDVLRLLSEGRETAEIAKKLGYSERTIKSVLHKITSRLNLRNRQHAVAYALRSGVI